MKKYKTVEQEVLMLDALTCDKCGKDLIEADREMTDESFSIDFYGGYPSAFGDMNHVQCDLCHTCLYELIGKYCKFNEGENDE